MSVRLRVDPRPAVKRTGADKYPVTSRQFRKLLRIVHLLHCFRQQGALPRGQKHNEGWPGDIRIAGHFFRRGAEKVGRVRPASGLLTRNRTQMFLIATEEAKPSFRTRSDKCVREWRSEQTPTSGGIFGQVRIVAGCGNFDTDGRANSRKVIPVDGAEMRRLPNETIDLLMVGNTMRVRLRVD